MGRLPDTFNGRKIKKRIPYVMYAELSTSTDTNGNSFADSSFLHTVDKPFEIHSVGLGATVTSSSDPTTDLVPSAAAGGSYSAGTEDWVRLDILDTSANQRITKAATRMRTLMSRHSRRWEFEDPYTIEYQQGFTVTADNQSNSTLRIEIAFIGYLLVL